MEAGEPDGAAAPAGLRAPGSRAAAEPAAPAERAGAGGQRPDDDVLANIGAGLVTSFAAFALGAALGEHSRRGALFGIASAGLIALITAGIGGTRVSLSGPTAPMAALTATLVDFSRGDLFLELGLNATCDLSPDMYDADNHAAFRSNCQLPDQFCTMTLLLGAAIVVLAGALDLGKHVALVPNVVVSGFMNGIAVLIWQKQLARLLGAMPGSSGLNLVIALATVVLQFLLPKLTQKKAVGQIPTTLVVLLVMTVLCLPMQACTQDPEPGCVGKTHDIGGFSDVLAQQWPQGTALTMPAVKLALPLALDLALLCFLDTLLTALVVDKLVQARDGTDETTDTRRELAAQGFAGAVSAVLGGLPGAQATVRSVLIVRQGATMRLAGMAAGVFVLLEGLVLHGLGVVTHIPEAVFAGIMLKVAWDFWDWEPCLILLKSTGVKLLNSQRSTAAIERRYLRAIHALAQYDIEGQPQPRKPKARARELVDRYAHLLTERGEVVPGWETALADESLAERAEVEAAAKLRKDSQAQGRSRMLRGFSKTTIDVSKNMFNAVVDRHKSIPHVSLTEMVFVTLTALVTVLVSLKTAVLVFSALFHLVKQYGKVDLHDLDFFPDAVAVVPFARMGDLEISGGVDQFAEQSQENDDGLTDDEIGFQGVLSFLVKTQIGDEHSRPLLIQGSVSALKAARVPPAEWRAELEALDGEGQLLGFMCQVANHCEKEGLKDARRRTVLEVSQDDSASNSSSRSRSRSSSRGASPDGQDEPKTVAVANPVAQSQQEFDV